MRDSRILALSLRWSNVLALLALIVAASLLSPYFFDLRNIMNVLRGASVLCIVAVGMTLVILSRGVDLSAGSILGVSGATLAFLATTDPRLAIVAALAAGAGVGLVNGVLVAWLGLQPFIATVATLIAVRSTTRLRAATAFGGLHFGQRQRPFSIWSK